MVARNDKEIQCARFTLSSRQAIHNPSHRCAKQPLGSAYTKGNVRAGEMDQQGNHWFHKHEGQSVNPSTHVKSWVDMIAKCNLSTLELEEGDS